MGSVFTNKIHITNCFAITLEDDTEDSDVYINKSKRLEFYIGL